MHHGQGDGWSPLVGQLRYILSPVVEDDIIDSASFRSNRVGEEFPREGMMARLKRFYFGDKQTFFYLHTQTLQLSLALGPFLCVT